MTDILKLNINYGYDAIKTVKFYANPSDPWIESSSSMRSISDYDTSDKIYPKSSETKPVSPVLLDKPNPFVPLDPPIVPSKTCRKIRKIHKERQILDNGVWRKCTETDFKNKNCFLTTGWDRVKRKSLNIPNPFVRIHRTYRTKKVCNKTKPNRYSCPSGYIGRPYKGRIMCFKKVGHLLKKYTAKSKKANTFVGYFPVGDGCQVFDSKAIWNNGVHYKIRNVVINNVNKKGGSTIVSKNYESTRTWSTLNSTFRATDPRPSDARYGMSSRLYGRPVTQYGASSFLRSGLNVAQYDEPSSNFWNVVESLKPTFKNVGLGENLIDTALSAGPLEAQTKTVAKAMASGVILHNFVIVPTISMVSDTLKMLANIGDIIDKINDTNVNGYWVRNRGMVSRTDLPERTEFSGNLMYTIKTKRTEFASIQCKVKYISNAQRISLPLKLMASTISAAVYEAIPFSWAIDYFTDEISNAFVSDNEDVDVKLTDFKVLRTVKYVEKVDVKLVSDPSITVASFEFSDFRRRHYSGSAIHDPTKTVDTIKAPGAQQALNLISVLTLMKK